MVVPNIPTIMAIKLLSNLRVGINVAFRISVKSCLYKNGTIKYTNITIHKYFKTAAIL